LLCLLVDVRHKGIQRILFLVATIVVASRGSGRRADGLASVVAVVVKGVVLGSRSFRRLLRCSGRLAVVVLVILKIRIFAKGAASGESDRGGKKRGVADETGVTAGAVG
jgi:hypothetical protein